MKPPLLAVSVLATAAATITLWPAIDLWVAGLFFAKDAEGFWLSSHPSLLAAHFVASDGARVLGVLLLCGAGLSAALKRRILKLPTKAWTFLFLALLLGPGLVANVGLKDNWGRARPREVAEFGGEKVFSPPLSPSRQCERNCSFVSGDGSFGFYLTAFGFVAAARRRRLVFWCAMAAGAAFGATRIAMGAHFLSDTLFAALLMLATNSLLHALMFGHRETRECWKNFAAK